MATNTATSFKVSMSPWTNYTFRVIARNKVGDSLPSGHSKVCLTPEDVPYKNPENVIGRGTAPNNLVIYWTVRRRDGGRKEDMGRSGLGRELGKEELWK